MAIGLAGTLLVTGCGEPAPASFKFNAVELLKQEKLFLGEDESFDPRYKQEIGTILTAIFGTPDQPRLPSILAEDDPAEEIMSAQNLARAAGPVSKELQSSEVRAAGLYREHCAHCHGITGDGAGPTAAFLNPYPRDFRLGKFKFKSTPLRSVPTDEDMQKVLVNGVQGSSMPSFRTLPQEDLAALVDYVKYLTIRGQYERFLLAELSNLDKGEPLIDFAEVQKAVAKAKAKAKDDDAEEEDDEDEDEAQEELLDTMFALVGEALVEDVVSRWVDSDDNVSAVPPAPAAIALTHPDHSQLVQQGRELFYQQGNCAQCHGDSAVGNGQIENYDDWTNEWIKTAGVDPLDPTTYADFIRAGALPPRPVRPRNLTENIYRGGDHPDDIYLRIVNGIEGTPMPAAATLAPEQIWALVAYVKALPYEGAHGTMMRHKPVNEKAIAQ